MNTVEKLKKYQEDYNKTMLEIHKIIINENIKKIKEKKIQNNLDK